MFLKSKTMGKILKYVWTSLALCGLFLVVASCEGKCEDNLLDNPEEPSVTGNGGYLFAHMTPASYGHLFYSVSRDGQIWETLNQQKVILSGYWGHPNICKGGDGIYYMIGMSTGTLPHFPILWYSSDLIVWRHKDLSATILDVASCGYKNNTYDYGAPKIFYDEASKQYLISWHAGRYGNEDLDEEWLSKRTFYILTSDFETFTEPKLLFNFTGSDSDMATIDAIIEKVGDIYYAVVKDERWPDKCKTGKTIRIATSDNLTGPYSNPGPSVTPAWHEAHTLVKSMDEREWYLYTEAYNEQSYHLFKSSSLTGNAWSQVNFTPPVARHGCIIKIDESLYKKIIAAYSTH